jgi:hypothetical protein
MSCRKWVVRGLVIVVVSCCISAGVFYQQWTNPTAVREQVVEMLEKQFPGAMVTLDGARMRLFGGVVLTELRLTRREIGDKSEVLHIPSATVYPDKERLVKGEFAIRLIEMCRPRIHMVRNKDGTWNVSGLIGLTEPKCPLPTIVIQDGSLVIEDRLAGPARWEIHDVNLTLLNDPVTCLTFSGTGKSETLGGVELRGRWQRDTGVTALALETNSLCVNKELVQYVAGLYPHKNLAGLQVEGWADLKVILNYTPKATPALTHDVRCQLRQFRVDHPDLPVPLHNLSAALHCNGTKLTLERLKAAADKGHVECQGWADAANPEENFALELTALHLPLKKELADRLPDNGKNLFYTYNPVGNAKVQLQCEMKAGKWLRNHISLQPDSVSMCWNRFTYPIDRLTGTIEHDFVEQLSKFDAVGYAGTQPVTIKGHWKGAGVGRDALVEVTAQDLPLDKKLADALGSLGESIQRQVLAFHPTGRCQFHGIFKHVPGELESRSLYQVHFTNCKVKWDEFPYPLEEVCGDLLIYPHHYEYKNFHGKHNGGEVDITGQTLPRSGSDQDGKLIMAIIGRNLCIDADLRGALVPFKGLSKAWDTFAPAGRLGFQVQIERLPGKPHELDVTVDVAGCAIKPNFFQYQLHDVTGQFHYAKNKVDIANFTARHNNSQMSIEHGTIDLDAEHGGFYAKLSNLVGNPMLADDGLLGALPKGLRTTMETVNLKDQPFAFEAKQVVVSQGHDPARPPEIYWNGCVWVRDVELRAGIDLNHVTGTVACRGLHDGNKLASLQGNIYFNEATVFKQPFKDVHSHFYIPENEPDAMVFTLTQAPIFGGDISGLARLEFGSTASGMRYDIDLTAAQIQLEEFGRHNLGPEPLLHGIAAARLHLYGHGADIDRMEGNGSIDVPYSPLTRLLNLPPLVALLKFLGLRLPDRTAFEEAHAVFAIHGKRASVSKLDLLGNVISLYGQGEVNLDGTEVMLDFYPSWGRAEQIPLPPVVRELPSTISKQLMKIEMRGQLGGKDGDLQFSRVPVPGIVGPLLQMRDRLMGWAN